MKFLMVGILCMVEILQGSLQAGDVQQLYTYDQQKYILAKNTRHAHIVRLIKNIDALLAQQEESVSNKRSRINDQNLKNEKALTSKRIFIESLNPTLLEQEINDNGIACSVLLNHDGMPIFKGSAVSGYYEFISKISWYDIENSSYTSLKNLLTELLKNESPAAISVIVYNQEGFCQENRVVKFERIEDGYFMGYSKSNPNPGFSGFEQKDVSNAIRCE